MRTLLRALALVPLALSSVGPVSSGAATVGGAPTDVVSTMAGHWRCTSSGGTVTQRSYVVTDGAPVAVGAAGSATTRAAGSVRSTINATAGASTAQGGIARVVYGREDGPDSGPFFERIVQLSDASLRAQTPEGTSKATAADPSGIRFSALLTIQPSSEESTRDNLALASMLRGAGVPEPLGISYAVEPNGLRRVARLGGQTLSDDRCTRDQSVAVGVVCTNPNAPAAPIHAVQPPSTVAGMVSMRVVVDDRGQVVGEDVIASSSPSLTPLAIDAARNSTFTAAVQNCRGIAAQTTMAVQFRADPLRHGSNNGRETNL